MEQPLEKPSKHKLSKYPLYSNETPSFRQRQNEKFVGYGKHNDYPDYLAYLYNNSGIHNAVVKGKAAYVYGKGWQIKKDWVGDRAGLQKTLELIKADKLARRSIFEKTLYGAKAYLIEWGPFGKPLSIKVQPINTVRTNISKTLFYVSHEWTREMTAKSRYRRGVNGMPADVITYPAFDPLNPIGKQILYLIDENPASDIYALPEYEAGKTSIETDIECGFFHLNNVKSGFAAGTLITLFNGGLENEEAQEQVERDIKAKMFGTDNAGEGVVNFQLPNTAPPDIKPLRSNELDKQYEQLAKDVINKTLYAHRVSNGLLFGIKTPGELGGGRSEFDLAWEHFCNTYVKPRQQEEEADMNDLMKLYGYLGNPLELVVLDPVGLELDTATIMNVLNMSEKRKMVIDKLGIEPIVEPVLPQPVAPVPNKAFMKFEEDTILGKFESLGESADLFEIVMEIGRHGEFASDISDDDVVKAIKDNPKISVSALSEKLGVSEKKLYSILDRLNGQNILSVKYVERGGEVIIDTENVNPDQPKDVELLTKWQYKGPKDAKNRPFCAKMLANNRLYSRSDIEGLQNDMKDFNTDVWKYKGGWYHDPARDVNVPQCRHYWQQIIVRRK